MKKTRILSVVLTIVMLLSMVSVGATAFEQKSGTFKYPGTRDDIKSILQKEIKDNAVNANVKVMNASSWQYYDDLNETEKIMYDAIVDSEAGIFGTGSMEIEITNGDDFDCYDEITFYKSLLKVFASVIDDVPELYWILAVPYEEPEYYINEDDNTVVCLDINFDYLPYDSIEELREEYLDTINAAASFDVTGDTLYEQVASIAYGLCDLASYADITGYEGADNSKVFYPSSCLLYPYETVCDGYSKAFKMICDAHDIPSLVVVGVGYSFDFFGNRYGGGHAWNYVMMDDGNWYAIDTTWMDDNPNEGDYFLVGANTKDADGYAFEKTHVIDGCRFVVGDEDIVIYYPELNESAYDEEGAQPFTNDPGYGVSAIDGKILLVASETELELGDTFYVSAIVPEGATCVDAIMNYDADCFEYIESYPGSYSNQYGVTFVINDTQEGTIHYASACTTRTEEGSIFYAQFILIGDEGDITIDAVNVTDDNDETMYLDPAVVTITNKSAPTDEIMLGDVNGDNKISLVDAKWVLQVIANTRALTATATIAADTNLDGKISLVDAKYILQAIAGTRDLGTTSAKGEVVFYPEFEGIPDMGIYFGAECNRVCYYDQSGSLIDDDCNWAAKEYIYDLKDIGENGVLEYMDLLESCGFERGSEPGGIEGEVYIYFGNIETGVYVTVCYYEDANEVGVFIYGDVRLSEAELYDYYIAPDFGLITGTESLGVQFYDDWGFESTSFSEDGAAEIYYEVNNIDSIDAYRDALGENGYEYTGYFEDEDYSCEYYENLDVLTGLTIVFYSDTDIGIYLYNAPPIYDHFGISDFSEDFGIEPLGRSGDLSFLYYYYCLEELESLGYDVYDIASYYENEGFAVIYDNVMVDEYGTYGTYGTLSLYDGMLLISILYDHEFTSIEIILSYPNTYENTEVPNLGEFMGIECDHIDTYPDSFDYFYDLDEITASGHDMFDYEDILEDYGFEYVNSYEYYDDYTYDVFYNAEIYQYVSVYYYNDGMISVYLSY